MLDFFAILTWGLKTHISFLIFNCNIVTLGQVRHIENEYLFFLKKIHLKNLVTKIFINLKKTFNEICLVDVIEMYGCTNDVHIL